MRVHKYKFPIFKNSSGEAVKTQTRIYIPNKGIFGYSGQKIDFFSDDSDDMIEAVTAIEGGGGCQYLGEISIPDDLIKDLVRFGKAERYAREAMGKSFRSLIGILEEPSS